MWPVALFALMIDAKLAAIVCGKRFKMRRRFIRNVNRVCVCARACLLFVGRTLLSCPTHSLLFRLCLPGDWRHLIDIDQRADFGLAEIENAARRYVREISVSLCVCAVNLLERDIVLSSGRVHTHQSSRSSSKVLYQGQ